MVENQLQLGKDWLEQLLNLMQIAAEVNTEGFETVKTNLNSNWLEIDATNLSLEQKQQLIGKQGQTVDAIQYLANTILNISADPNLPRSFIIEIDGYRVRRNQELAILTQEAIEKVQATGQPVEIPGLSSAERKQVHSILDQAEGLVSESRGQEPDRKLIVRFGQVNPADS